MLALRVQKAFLFTLLVLFTHYSISYESYDDKLYKISKSHSSFSGLYIDKNGNAVLLIKDSTELSTLKGSIFKSNSDLKKAIGEQFVTDLENFYGPHRFSKHIKVTAVKYSFSQLYEWFNQIYKELNILIKLTVNRMDIDEVNNKISLGLTNDSYKQEVKNHLLKSNIPIDAIFVDKSELIYLQ